MFFSLTAIEPNATKPQYAGSRPSGREKSGGLVPKIFPSCQSKLKLRSHFADIHPRIRKQQHAFSDGGHAFRPENDQAE